MPVELRKRKAPVPAPAPAPPKKKANAQKASSADKPNGAVNGATPTKLAVGDVITLEGFGGEIQTQDEQKTSLKAIVDESEKGVVLFTYPKASTPGCTQQACLFRDSYKQIAGKGFAVYGLSTDSPKANATFKTKQDLPYPLLCDPDATLIDAIGFKKAPKGTTRAVFVIDKQGKILAAQPGGPGATLDVVVKLIEEQIAPGQPDKSGNSTEKPKKEGHADDVAKAQVAADVADTAAKIDGSGEKDDKPKL
ncbi:MAG: hypothetical protein M1833_004852 [Piccolia ochrophora]|nr:MAG: hypothetical protein M1833_004852 [Piccolia ochrophora]